MCVENHFKKERSAHCIIIRIRRISGCGSRGS